MNANNSAIDTNTATGTTGTTTTTLPYRPSTTGESILSGSRPNFAERGWICPVCGRGCSPNTAYCNCNDYRSITYLNRCATLGSTIPDTIDCADNACTAKVTT